MSGQPEPGLIPSRGYLICTIERTGSNLLAEALSGTGVAGRPIEYFNPVMQDKQKIRAILGGSSVIDGLTKILRAGATPNGVFGAKLHWPHFRYLGMSIKGEWHETKRTRMHDLMRSQSPKLLSLKAVKELLNSEFSDLRAQTAAYALLRSHLPDLRFIWLKRNNMVARAISIYRARTTDVWYRSAGKPDPSPAEEAIDFNLSEIHNLYCIGAFQEESWQRFFKQNNISPYSIAYEELTANYEATIRGVLEFLEIEEAEVVIPKPISAKQSDAMSAEWERRYRDLVADANA
jgi:LPS sulfotransferase NodH